jgi:AraC-like DNA-binding protein
MSELCDLGVVFTEHSDLRAAPLLSLWSYETQGRGRHRRAIERNRDGNHTYWLERSDPLLNTILPGTAVSLVVNFGERWAAGRSLTTSALLPRCAVVGPVTQPQILKVGIRVQAIGAVLPAALTTAAFGVPPEQLVNRIVSLGDVWSNSDVERLFESLAPLPVRQRLATLSHALVARTPRPYDGDRVGHAASRLMTDRRGRVSIEEVAGQYGISRQQFSRRFSTATGFTPKLFARITRFQAVVNALLTSEVSEWASVAPAMGFYDQAHMINEFGEFAGSPPTVFFQPHGDKKKAPSARLRGRPHEWQPIEAGAPSSVAVPFNAAEFDTGNYPAP